MSAIGNEIAGLVDKMFDQDNQQNPDDAAQAFERLRDEVAQMRRAVDRLAAAQAVLADKPDYSETVGVILQNLSATAQPFDALLKSPALSLAPEENSRQIIAADIDARREDHRLFLAAKQGMDEVATRPRHRLDSLVMAVEQGRWLWRVGLAGFATGMILWATFAGPIARILPLSCLMPERMAARLLRMPMSESGQRLMQGKRGLKTADYAACAMS